MIRPATRGQARLGTILILVAGMSALLAIMALTFLVRMRTDVEESLMSLQEAQARIMLAAGCNYIQECSRLGWDRYPNAIAGTNAGIGTSYAAATQSNDPFPGDSSAAGAVNIHEETFGWVDVRDGSPGPTTQEGRICYDPTLTGIVWWADTPNLRPLWPAPTSVVRCPMYVWQRPPCATQLTAAYNPILTDPGQTANPVYLYPFMNYPDPQPEVSNSWTPGATTVSSALYDDGVQGATGTDFIHGNNTPRQQTVGKSWFRVLREGPATFLITVGSGGSLGFRTYAEVQQQGYTALFNNDPVFFQNLMESELRLWYRVEWSAAVTDVTYHWNLHHTLGAQDNYTQWPQNSSHSWTYGPRSSGFDRNMGGTFRWIERIRMEPTNW